MALPPRECAKQVRNYSERDFRGCGWVKLTSPKSSAPSILLLNDKYDADRKAYRDNKPTEIVYAMRGIFVPTGSHEIVPMKSFSNTTPTANVLT
jgi:hypothetical protein